MKKIKNIFTLLVVALAGLSLTACSNDDLDTDQFQGGVALNVYGPTPVMRGGQLRFIGSNLDQVREVIIPSDIHITNIQVVSAGVPSEIRITVPKDGPVEGLVTLVTNSDQRITTKTPLKYEEGIEITKMTASAMPGDVIKIERDYLNLIHSLAFADKVLVSEADFVSHDRYAIEVKVPEEAKTGKLELYTADLTVVDKNSVEYQIIMTDDAIEIGVPAIEKVKGRQEAAAQGAITAKAGEQISITGAYFNVAASVTVGGFTTTDIKVSADGKTLTFNLPVKAPSGEIIIVCKSGVEVPVGTLTTVKPTEAVAAPNPVKAGQALTISGQDMDLVTAVTFPAGDATVEGGEITVTATSVVVKAVPETATAGNLKLVMANAETVDVAFTLVMPTITAYNVNPASAGSPLQISGTDLDLVKSITFGEAEAKLEEGAVSADGKKITVTVPMEGKSGKPKFNLANGTSVEGLDLQIDEAVFCYFTELPAEDAELKAGDSFTLPVANGDKLTGVEINGESCQFVLTGSSQLIIGIPDKAKKASKVRLISSNGEITYTIDFIPNTEVTTVLWTGTVDLGSWSINWEIGKGAFGDNNPNMFKDKDLQEGDVIRVSVTPYNDWWNVKFYDGHWNDQKEAGVAAGVGETCEITAANYKPEEHGGAIEFIATAKMVEQLTTLTDWGMCWIINGEGVVITKIAVTHYNSLETTLWEGNEDMGEWNNQPYILSDGGKELQDLGAKAGQIIRCYGERKTADWQLQVLEGHWSDNNNPYGNWGSWSDSEMDANGCLAFELTQTMLDRAYTSQGWGGVFVVQGKNFILKKITIE
jgi:hypothetical protein